jgi:nucleoid DNA-binding protein
MTKPEWIKRIHRRSGQTQLPTTRVQAVADATIEEIGPVLKEEGRLVVTGLGTFKVVDQPERLGRNPRTGETLTVAASRTVRFKPSPALKHAVQAPPPTAKTRARRGATA